jgi:hypothetical protein
MTLSYVRCKIKCIYFFVGLTAFEPITVVTLSKAYVCGRSLAGIAGSNRAGGVDVFLL